MIREISISAYGTSEDGLTEPPGRVLNATLLGDRVALDIYEMGELGVRSEQPTATIEVPVASLQIALDALVADHEKDAGQ